MFRVKGKRGPALKHIVLTFKTGSNLGKVDINVQKWDLQSTS